MFVDLIVWGFDLGDGVQRIRMRPCDWRVVFPHCPAIGQITLGFHALCMIFSFNHIVCFMLPKIVCMLLKTLK
jgi:hypothetical protein